MIKNCTVESGEIKQILELCYKFRNKKLKKMSPPLKKRCKNDYYTLPTLKSIADTYTFRYFKKMFVLICVRLEI